MTRSRALTAVAASAVVLGSLNLASSAGAQSAPASSHLSPAVTASHAKPHRGCHHGASIVGTWQMMIDPLPNHGIDPPAFPSLVQFAAGGTMTDSVSSVPGAPFLVTRGANGSTSGLGAWSQKCRTITFAFERFITADGKFVARQHIEGTTTVSDHGMKQGGPVVATFFDTNMVNPNPLGPPVNIDATGTRLLP